MQLVNRPWKILCQANFCQNLVDTCLLEAYTKETGHFCPRSDQTKEGTPWTQAVTAHRRAEVNLDRRLPPWVSPFPESHRPNVCFYFLIAQILEVRRKHHGKSDRHSGEDDHVAPERKEVPIPAGHFGDHEPQRHRQRLRRAGAGPHSAAVSSPAQGAGGRNLRGNGAGRPGAADSGFL